jgi:cathepsin L
MRIMLVMGATAGTENAHKRASGTLLTLSEQQLVDCDPKSHGCSGGWHFWAWDYLKTKAQVLETQYPYTGRQATCSSTKSAGGVVTPTTYSRLTPGSVAQHKAGVQQGVIAIALAAGSSAFQLYRSGVLTGTACGTQINHAVATVGWGTENGIDYWIVRNSWGGRWGDKGHIKLAAVEGQGVCASQNYSYIVTTN